jgi:hypothetical protein
MASRAGVGFSENPVSYQAGVEAASQAMAEAGASRCDLAILYSTARHDPAQLQDGVRSVIGSTARLDRRVCHREYHQGPVGIRWLTGWDSRTSVRFAAGGYVHRKRPA